MTDRAHYDPEGLARRRDRLTVANRHRLCKRSLHDSDDAGPFSIGDLDSVFLDSRVGRVNKHRFQVGDVPINAMRDVAIGPR
jgi:hypothetical protein